MSLCEILSRVMPMRMKKGGGKKTTNKGMYARSVDIKKAMKSWRNRFSGCRLAQARRKASRTFKGRLRAFLLIFQHRANNSDRRGHQHFSRTFPLINMRRWAQGASSRAAGGRPCPDLRWPTAPRAAAAQCRALFKLRRKARVGPSRERR